MGEGVFKGLCVNGHKLILFFVSVSGVSEGWGENGQKAVSRG